MSCISRQPRFYQLAAIGQKRSSAIHHSARRFNASLADHFTPAWRVPPDDCRELLWRSACGQHAELEKLLPPLGRLDDAVDLRPHALNDRARRANRCQDAVPPYEVERVALFGESR